MDQSNGQSLIEDFLFIEDAQERLNAIVDRSRRLTPFSADERNETNRVPGCISQVWLISEFIDEQCRFRCDADGPLVKGLVAFLCAYYEGSTPSTILVDDVNPLVALDLLRNLSPTRQNGLSAVRAAIRLFAQNQSVA